MQTAQTFKLKYAALRANAGMNQDEWAAAIGVDKQTVSNWETMRSEPKLSHLRKMSELSGVPMDYISLGEEPIISSAER